MNGFVITRLQSLLKKTKVSEIKEAYFAPNSKVLIISPHYDDDVLSCFGAMMRHVEATSEIHIIYVTDGSSSVNSGLTKEELINTRKKEAQRAIESYFYGVKLLFLEKTDGAFYASVEDNKWLAELLEKEKYDYIYSPAISDTHEDHKESYHMLRAALIKSRHRCIIRFYEFWYPLANPNLYVDLGAFSEKKTKSISYHVSQLKFLDYIGIAKFINDYRGNQVGIKSAEVYEQVMSEELIEKPSMKVSVVIPAYNNEEYVIVMLKALSRQKCDFDDWEIVLVDDSEDDRMTHFKTMKIPNLRIVEKKHSGRADTRNVGIRESYGDIIVFMDSDMIVDENFVQSHFDAHKDGFCDIALGRVNHILNENLETVRNLVEENKIHELSNLVVSDNYLNLARIVFSNRKIADHIGWVCCLFSNCSVKREVLDKSGLFDLIFVGWGLEDVEMGYRFFKENFKFSYFENIQNYHVDHSTDSNKMLVEMGQNLKRFSKKHPDKAIKSYMSFVAGFKDLNELLCDVAEEEILFDEGKGIYFKPLYYAKSKE